MFQGKPSMVSGSTVPPPPPRLTSGNSGGGSAGVRFGSVVHWRESLAVLLCFILAGVILISVLVLAVYGLRYRAVYEELVDYLDKTISISKINFNHLLGLYELSEKELNALSYHRSYKTTLWVFLAGELASYIFFAAAVLLYYAGGDISRGPMHIVFWVFFSIGLIYCLIEASVFSFMLFPYSGTLPNSTEQLLNHAIPHNPGGLLQMELRVGCTFDLNLYDSKRRTQNPKNSCDPSIANTFLSRPLLVVLLAMRIVPVILFPHHNREAHSGSTEHCRFNRSHTTGTGRTNPISRPTRRKTPTFSVPPPALPIAIIMPHISRPAEWPVQGAVKYRGSMPVNCINLPAVTPATVTSSPKSKLMPSRPST